MLRKFRANRISLKPQGFNITVAVRQYHSLRQQRISLSLCDNITLCVSKEYHFIPTEKEITFRRITDLLSLSICNKGLGLAPNAFDQSNAMLALSGVVEILR